MKKNHAYYLLSLMALLVVLLIKHHSVFLNSYSLPSFGANIHSDANQEISVSFSPGNAENAVVNAINNSKSTLDLAAYSFTSKVITKALLRAEQRGVKVRVVVDNNEGIARYSTIPELIKSDIQVRYNGNYQFMHDKYFISDSVTVETGSFNYTSSAAHRNAENVILLKNNATVADSYYQDFERLWRQGTKSPEYNNHRVYE
ncbi:TPA: phospholipase D family protein [Klebsiella aerogenes]